jgi:glycosyltransferase involved in cell wall biosynthesis
MELAAATSMPAGEIRVVPNGIDRGRFLGLAPATLGLIDALDLHTAAPVLLTPARVMPRKNLELAVRVVLELRRSGEDARLLLTGAPDAHDPGAHDQLDALRTIAQDEGSGQRADSGVHLLVDGPPAWRSARVVADLFRIADALFLPSREEGFGLPVLEAGVSRLPVICADIPALRELAGDDATYVDPGGDPTAVAAQVRGRLDADPAYRLAARSRSSFSWDAVYETRIRPLLEEAGG